MESFTKEHKKVPTTLSAFKKSICKFDLDILTVVVTIFPFHLVLNVGYVLLSAVT